MDIRSLDFINAKIVNRTYTTAGEITVTSTLTFDNGFTATGTATRDISGYDATEAQKAADDAIIATLVPGVASILPI